MRVVAGTHRGRRLEAPRDRQTRPSTDRVREATFNALGSLGVVEDARVLDLYAGTGALGIEALSRGATHCTFVERDPSAARLVARNLSSLGLSSASTVVLGDVRDFIGSTDETFDLALLDPPYGLEDEEGWSDLLQELPADVAVLESAGDPQVPDPWTILRQRRYGTTLVTIVSRAPEAE